MASKKIGNSLWFISEDYENNLEFSSPSSRSKYLREAKKLLRSQSQLGKAAVLIDIAWKLEGNVPRAYAADFLFNDQVQSPRMRAYVKRRLRQIGLDEGGLPLGSKKSKHRLGREMDDWEQAFPVPPKKARGKKRRTIAATTVESLLAKIRARKNIPVCRPIFAGGMQVVPSPGVMETCDQIDVERALDRFTRCDWGDVPRSQALRNNRVTRQPRPGEGVYGIYQSRRGVEFWVIASVDSKRAAVLLPVEM